MIHYRNFFKYLKQNQISETSMLQNHELSSSTLDFMKRHINGSEDSSRKADLRTSTIAKICSHRNCSIEDILEADIKNDHNLQEAVRDAKAELYRTNSAYRMFLDNTRLSKKTEK